MAAPAPPPVLAVPQSMVRRALEVEGWLEFGCHDIALEKVQPLLEVPGARIAGLFLRARALVDAGRFTDALRDIEELRPLHDDQDWVDLTEAWCRKRLGDVPGAADCMRRLIVRDGRNAIGHFNLGCYLALLGDRRGALDELTTACGLDDTFRGSPLDDDDLSSLHGEAEFEALRQDGVS